MPGGPVDPPATWAATSNVEVEVEQSTNLRRVEREGREGSEGQSHKEKDRKWGVEWGMGPGTLSYEGGLYLAVQVSPKFCIVTPLLMGPVCLLSWGRFEEPVRP